MNFTRKIKYFCIFYLFTGFFVFSKTTVAVNKMLISPEFVFQVQDTVKTGSAVTLPFPFKDKPSFGKASDDSSKLYLKDPGNIKYEIEYDAVTGQYVFYQKIGNMNYRLPQTMSREDFVDYDFEQSVKEYWRQRTKVTDNERRGGILPKLTIGGEAFNRIFGGNTINIQPQGAVEVSFGYQVNKTENPAIPERLRRVPTFDFDEKIQMSVMGQIGTKMNMRVNYNTEATFDYENKMNLEYAGDEDEILKKIEAGNVSLPLSGSLITGGSNLFGIKSELQFGKLTLTTLFSQSKGETQTVETEGGAQITTFEIPADAYDANRHFFLAQYFRDHYDEWLQNTAVPRSPITINKIEIWVTNKSSNFSESRNILGFQDLGEHKPNIFNKIPSFQETTGLPFPENVFPHNDANGLYFEMTNTYSAIRNNENITAIMSQFGSAFTGGQDFEKIEQARKLNQSEFSVNERLGYISLNQSLNSDEVLAVAYNFTYNGKTYQVGEFSTDGINSPQTLILKLLKGTNLTPYLPTWKLMMKNIYNLNAYQLTNDEFIFNVVYQNDSTGTYINYLPESRIKGQILLEVMNLDKLNKQKDPYKDGVFDYIDGITVMSRNGKIIFPVLEPFGKHLAKAIQDPKLIQKYTFQSLYDSTRVYAEQDAEHNKFRLAGSYKGASSSDISLGAFNLAKGSVKVSAGGRQLVENVDYTVDYTLGRVKVINQALLEAGTPISVSTESEEIFSMQRKTLMGLHANYAISDRFNLGAAALYMHERPLTQKIDYGQDPVSNLIIGMDARYSTQSKFLSKMVDALPFYSTKAPSSIDFDGEIAQLIPGHSKVIDKSGTAYIDDFEGTKTTIDLKARQAWTIASTPQLQKTLFPEGDLSNTLEYGYNRAKLAYYIIDPLFLRNSSLTPAHIKNNPDLQSNHFVREVHQQEIFPAKETPAGIPTNIPVFDMAFYPEERGPYNYDSKASSFSAGINPEGSLRNPRSRWGGIMRKIETSDFETANIEFIEFWMMDPFVYDTLGRLSGGDLFFNLGDISEDILRDSKKAFENGLPTSDINTNTTSTIWGRVSTQQSLVNAFDNNPNSRRFQDVGFDGLNDDNENKFFENFLNDVKSIVSPNAFEALSKDPSSDNYHYYRGSNYDDLQLGILERYKKFNGPDGNSPTTEMSPESYPTSASTIPDIEDINNDNTLNEYEKYYQYKVSIRKKDMVLGKNYITDVVERSVELENRKQSKIKWYQFKIPVREPGAVFGNIRDFKSIRFLRTFLQGFDHPVILRFATLELVRADWRRYTRSLGDQNVLQPNTEFDVSAVSIEENGVSKDGINYVLPPGISRVIDPANPQLRNLNEQAMTMKVTNLEQGDAKAAYKNIYMDFRRYKRLKLEIHAQEIKEFPLKDDELYFFIRIGSDFNFNYYEYEIPLKLTPRGFYNNDIESDRYIVWPDENRLDIPLEVFTNLKLARNDDIRKAGSKINIQTLYESFHKGVNKNRNRVKIKGSPNLENVEVMMIGIRNRKGQVNTGPKSVIVWANELRLAEFDEQGGWAANARVSTRLADLGSITFAGRTRSSGFGSLSQNINSRQLEDLAEFDIASSVDLGKFFPEKAGVQIPMYYGYSKSTSTPKYNPLEPDIEMDRSLKHAANQEERDSIKFISQDVITRKSLNFTNIKVDPQTEKTKVHIWDPTNFAVTYSYNETFRRSIETEYNLDKTYRGMFSYNFSSRSEQIRPFGKVGFLNKGPLKLLGDFSFYPLPAQISYRTDLFRRYHEIQTRNITNPNLILPATFEKDFMWNRALDLRYDLTQSLKFDFTSNSTSRIDEPMGRMNKLDDDYKIKRDSILTSLYNLGRPTLYNHSINIMYTLPLNRIPFLSFINSSLNYTSDYNWMAGPITADTIRLGNNLENSNNIQLNTNISLTSVYSKVPYFRELEEKFRRTGRSQYSMNRQYNTGGSSSNSSNSRGRAGVEPLQQKVKEETFTSNTKLVANESQKITHNLKTKKVNVVATGVEGKVVTGKINIIDVNTIEFIPSEDVAQAMIEVKGKPGDQGLAKDMIDLFARMLIGVKTVSITYSSNGGTVLPGYMPQPILFGAGNYTPDRAVFGREIPGGFAPGLPFLMGWQERQFARKAAENGWITNDSSLNLPYLFNKNERFYLNATVEPLPDLRVDVTAERSISRNVSEFYNYNHATKTFNANSLKETGNFSMSTFTWGTAFFAIGGKELTKSETFNKLKENRMVIARRLAAGRNPNNGFGYDPSKIDPKTGFPDGYGPNSVEVLVPAFLAAYQNADPYKISLDMFPSVKFIRPNWRVQYEGMVSRIPGLNRFIRSLNFTHAYRSTYNVGSFLTNLNYEAEGDGFSYIRDLANNFIPAYDFNSVNIMETFSPLINIDVMWMGELTTRAEMKRSRNLNLAFANGLLTEILSDEYTIGAGYRFTRMDLIIKTKNSQQSFSNDLNLRVDLSMRKNKTNLRSLAEIGDQITQGSSNVTIKTTADYRLSDRFEVRLFYDRIMNNPFVATAFKTANTNVGVSFRFTLAQ